MSIRDQRTMVGPYSLFSPVEVRNAWTRLAGDPSFPGFVNRNRERVFVNAPQGWDPPVARIDAARWLADCTNPDCNGAMACWPEHAQAACFDCGYIFNVTYPPPPVVMEAIDALALRPELNRHWDPGTEEPSDLRQQNIQYGYPVPDVGAQKEAKQRALQAAREAVDLSTRIIPRGH